MEGQKSPLRLTGIGLRPPHYAEFLDTKPSVAWVEVHSENFFAEGGKPLHFLEKIRLHYPISLHGVGLSIGSADELNWQHLKKLRELSNLIDPCLISDHLSWSSINGHYLHDLLPIPYIDEAIPHLVSRIQQIQDYLKRQILIENVSSYVSFKHTTLPEWEFLTQVATRSGCGILLDVNNIYISGFNLGFNPQTYISSIPSHLVQEVHLAGFTSTYIENKKVFIDTHSQPVAPEVWMLYQFTIQKIGTKPTIIEWDNDLPSLETLYLQAYKAEQMMRNNHVVTKSAS